MQCTSGEYVEDNVGDDFELRGDWGVIGPKWCLDGCRTLADVVQRLQDEAARYGGMIQQGWELVGPVEDGRGYIRQARG